MVKLPENVQEAFNSVFGVVLCTANDEGQPNGNVIAIKKIVDDETVYLSDQFFSKTLANLRQNDKVAIAFWGDKGAYQIHGTARYVNEGSDFLEEKDWANSVLESLGLPPCAKGGCFVSVESVYQMASGPDAGTRIA